MEDECCCFCFFVAPHHCPHYCSVCYLLHPLLPLVLLLLLSNSNRGLLHVYLSTDAWMQLQSCLVVAITLLVRLRRVALTADILVSIPRLPDLSALPCESHGFFCPKSRKERNHFTFDINSNLELLFILSHRKNLVLSKLICVINELAAHTPSPDTIPSWHSVHSCPSSPNRQHI